MHWSLIRLAFPFPLPVASSAYSHTFPHISLFHSETFTAKCSQWNFHFYNLFTLAVPRESHRRIHSEIKHRYLYCLRFASRVVHIRDGGRTALASLSVTDAQINVGARRKAVLSNSPANSCQCLQFEVQTSLPTSLSTSLPTSLHMRSKQCAQRAVDYWASITVTYTNSHSGQRWIILIGYQLQSNINLFIKQHLVRLHSSAVPVSLPLSFPLCLVWSKEGWITGNYSFRLILSERASCRHTFRRMWQASTVNSLAFYYPRILSLT